MTKKADILFYPTGEESNIVKLPTRNFPSIAIQGDTWSTYLSNASEALKIAKKIGDDELVDHLDFLVESLETYKEIYEEVIKCNGYELPYVDESKE